MGTLLYLVLLAVSGLFVGAFARLALPGKDPLSIPATMAVGIVGSFLAGLAAWAVFGRGGGGLVLSILFATAIMYAIRRSRGGGLLSPGGRGRRGDLPR